MVNPLFPDVLIDKILVGRKTQTTRDYEIKVGRVVHLMSNHNRSLITRKYIKITKAYKKTLGTFTDEDGKREGFSSLAELIDYWNKKLAKKVGEWNPKRVMWVHEFELVEK